MVSKLTVHNTETTVPSKNMDPLISFTLHTTYNLKPMQRTFMNSMQITGTPACFGLFTSALNVNHTSSNKNKVQDEKKPTAYCFLKPLVK
jgi:hypothetical protein